LKPSSTASTPTRRCTRSSCNCPLPIGVNEEEVLLRVLPEKDVDGLHPTNLGRLVMGAPGPLPCTPAGIVELLAAYDVPVEGKHVVIIGRGLTIGRPLALLLAMRRPHCNAAVTVVHTGVEDMDALVRSADVIVAAAGRAGLVTRDMVKPGAAVVGAGTSFSGRKLLSDVDEDVSRSRGLDHAAPRWRWSDDPCHAVTQRRTSRGEGAMTTTDSKGREYDERPWGSFTVLDDELFDHKVKRIVVAPGSD
jgi:hypothetical protein